MIRRTTYLVVAVAAALLSAAPAQAAELGFTRPTYVDQQLAGGEPLVTEDPTRHILLYTSHEGTTHIYRQGAPALTTFTFLGSYRNQVNMWYSKDDGRSWTHVNAFGTGFEQNPAQNTGFSDPDLTADEGGRLYNTGINLANDALFSSNDGGVTWDRGTAQCHDGDRPWIAGGRKDEAFLATNTAANGHQIFRSTDGGQTCDQTGIDSPDGNGKLYYDHANQRLIEPINVSGGGIGVATWRRGDPAFKNHVAVKGVTMYAHWPSIALDDEGGVYLVYDDDPRQAGTGGGCDGNPTPVANSVRLVYSPDFGEHWNAPITIAKPVGRRVFWPWVVAGDKGKVNVVWYETNKVVDLACQNADISVKTATLTGADTANPAMQTIDPIGRPISVDSNICQSGTTCVATGEDRRLGDFFTNSVDSVGCVLIATGDTYTPDPVSGGKRPVSLPLFVRQTSGPALRGSGDCNGQSSAANPVLPAPGSSTTGSGQSTTLTPTGQRVTCFSRRIIRINLRTPEGDRIARATVKVQGKRAVHFKGTSRKLRLRRINGVRATRIPVNLQGLRQGRYTVTITATTRKGKRIRAVRRYRTCLQGT